MVSNSSCTPTFRAPILSTGILPHDGRNIRFREVTETIRAYNFAPSFCYFAANNIAGILDRDYNTDTFDLSDIDVHNGIEHDASLTRKLSCDDFTVPHKLMSLTLQVRIPTSLKIRASLLFRELRNS